MLFYLKKCFPSWNKEIEVESLTSQVWHLIGLLLEVQYMQVLRHLIEI